MQVLMNTAAVITCWVIFGIFDIIAVITAISYYKNKKKGRCDDGRKD